MPLQYEWRLAELESVPVDGTHQAVAFLVVVAVYPIQRHRKACEYIQRLRLGNVARMDHPLNARRIEELNDALHVFEVVVGIADDANFHKAKKTPGLRKTRRVSSRVAKSGFFEDVYATGTAKADDVRHTDSGAFYLPLTCFAA